MINVWADPRRFNYSVIAVPVLESRQRPLPGFEKLLELLTGTLSASQQPADSVPADTLPVVDRVPTEKRTRRKGVKHNIATRYSFGVCPECGKTFEYGLRTRARDYCSVKCAQRVASREYRQRKKASRVI